MVLSLSHALGVLHVWISDFDIKLREEDISPGENPNGSVVGKGRQFSQINGLHLAERSCNGCRPRLLVV